MNRKTFKELLLENEEKNKRTFVVLVSSKQVVSCLFLKYILHSLYCALVKRNSSYYLLYDFSKVTPSLPVWFQMTP